MAAGKLPINKERRKTAKNGMAYPCRFLLRIMGTMKGKGEPMTRITISLQDPEKMALRVLAETEYRDPRQQAALIIRQELERRGLLVIGSNATAEPGRAVVKALATMPKTAKV
jgi:hypothetical protein